MDSKAAYTSLNELPLMLTVKDLTQILGIGRNSAYNLLKNSAIKSVRIGNSLRIPRDALIAYIYQQN